MIRNRAKRRYRERVREREKERERERERDRDISKVHMPFFLERMHKRHLST